MIKQKKTKPLERSSFPIVGIGASAGGLAAFEAFFSAMPADRDPNMAFVLVQHLAPDHKSILTDLIRKYTHMEVFEVEDGVVVRANCTYIIPPNRDMAYINGTLQLIEPIDPRGHRLPIDYFFRSLAADLHEKAICIILSGTGSDGTLGLRAIKGEGGMAMVQNPASTEFDGMPRSALSTGMIDYELPPAEMPAQLMAYTLHAFGKPPHQISKSETKEENSYQKIFVLLRAHTAHDFSLYKPSTVNRRVERRMAVNQIENLSDYVRFLQQTPGEVDSLFHDLLIGVTNFFRDPEVFQVLEKQIFPQLLEKKPSGSTIRIWVTGCSTGEEAYSIAILLSEYLDQAKKDIRVQIFATDIDDRAIATARAGLYPGNITADVTKERIQHYFTVKQTHSKGKTSEYRIRKSIRDMLIFSEQNLVRDPPFSKIDFISCRNLLIYMGVELQKKIIPLFHYALNPGGILLLGTSETVGDFTNLFAPLDRKLKIYSRKDEIETTKSIVTIIPSTELSQRIDRKFVNEKVGPKKPSLQDLTEHALLSQINLTGVLINAQGDILYMHGRSGMYLEPPQGETCIINILKMAREGLKRDLSVTLHKAIKTKIAQCQTGLKVKTNGDFSTVNLTVIPMGETLLSTTDMLYLVVLEEAQPPSKNVLEPSINVNQQIVSLKKELKMKEEYLQSSNEELESSNEELKSSNEEMQSVNEELQSTNEELETSKEELQSVNEELSTVNAELQSKVADLSRVNNDMNNLLAGTGIGTIFVDSNLRILRFTPPTSKIINLIQSDLGRPLGHIASNLVGYDSMIEDVKEVLDTLIPKELEVQTKEKKYFAMRIQPYRTIDNVIEGVVVTFVDITEMKETRDMLRKTNDLLRLAIVVRDSHDAITVQDLVGSIIAWNPGAQRMYGWSEEEALRMNVHDRIPSELRKEELSKIVKLSQSKILESYLTKRITKKGETIEVSVISTALMNDKGVMYAVATTERMKA